MESSLIQRNQRRLKRALWVRKKARGTSQKPRLSIIKSNRHVGVQLIDDESGSTLASVSTVMKQFRGTRQNKKAAAKLIGAEIAKRAKEKNISTVVFDRGFNQYHGVIAELASAAREGGLQF